MTVDDLRRTLATSLPEHLAAVMAGYDRFTAQSPPDDAKGFAAHHAAAKAALSHLDLLVKLVRWCSGDVKAADGTAVLLAQARQALGIADPMDDEDEEDIQP